MSADSLYGHTLKTNNGADYPLAGLEDKTLLIVNTASKCGFTPQYEGLEALHRKYGGRGLVVIGVPCDQFAHQEPGTDGEIAEFCRINYGVSFPLMAKTEVNGPGAHPLFVELRRRAGGILGDAVKWNFTKFLVSPNAKRITRYAPSAAPESLEADIEAALSGG